LAVLFNPINQSPRETSWLAKDIFNRNLGTIDAYPLVAQGGHLKQNDAKKAGEKDTGNRHVE